MKSSCIKPVLAVLLLLPAIVQGQRGRAEDLAFWPWLQVEKKIGRISSAEVQCQLRFNENISQFQRANFYFKYGLNLKNGYQVDLLYQLNTNHQVDQHTFFLGVTHRWKLTPKTNLYYRSAFQYIRNYFTGDVQIDEPYVEWRNRLRIKTDLGSHFAMAVSVEPYVRYVTFQPPVVSRARLIVLGEYEFNKYQTYSAYMLIQPDIVSNSFPETDYVIGLTWHMRLPDTWKGFSKLFKARKSKKGKSDSEDITPDVYQ